MAETPTTAWTQRKGITVNCDGEEQTSGVGGAGVGSRGGSFGLVSRTRRFSCPLLTGLGAGGGGGGVTGFSTTTKVSRMSLEFLNFLRRR